MAALLGLADAALHLLTEALSRGCATLADTTNCLLHVLAVVLEALQLREPQGLALLSGLSGLDSELLA